MKRPTSVTVFGILNLVFAVLGVAGLAGTMALFAPSAASSHNPLVPIIQNHPVYAAWMQLTIALGLLGTAAQFLGGMGLLKVRPWGRQLSMGFAIYALIMVVAGSGMNLIFLGGGLGLILGGVVGLVYPALLLGFMRRPNVIAAFAAPAKK